MIEEKTFEICNKYIKGLNKHVSSEMYILFSFLIF